MGKLKETWHFMGDLSSPEDVYETYGDEIIDGTRVNSFAYCPRSYEIQSVMNKRQGEGNRRMIAGSAMHAALDYYQHTDDEEGSLQALRDACEEMGLEDIPPGNAEHLTTGHLEACLRYYFDQWNRERVDIYSPIRGFTIDDLDLSDVIAARFRTTDDGRVVFGESAIIMRFALEELGGEWERDDDLPDHRHVPQLVYAGKPDLPVQNQMGDVYIMDHKTTSGWLSSWFWRKFMASNKMRGYMAMIDKLLPSVSPSGYVINGICLHERAGTDAFGGTRSERKEWAASEESVREALKNIYHWKRMIASCREADYYPQGCYKCRHPDLCKEDPEVRDDVLDREYTDDPVTKFFQIP